jgi:hypothetical protein
MFGLFKKKERRKPMIDLVRWPLSSFRRPETNQPAIWNNRFGSQNRLSRQFNKLWSISLRSLW